MSMPNFFAPGGVSRHIIPPQDAAKPGAAAAIGTSTTPTTVYANDSSIDGDNDDLMPWEQEGWVPTMKSGKQKTPNQIRNEFQKYLDTCGRTQTEVLSSLNINNNSFRRFMNPKTYKNQWSAVDNGTYWAAARLLAKHAHEQKLKKEEERKNNKRKSGAGGGDSTNKKAKSIVSPAPGVCSTKDETEKWMLEVMATPDVNTDKVYDSCPEVVQKIKKCLADHPGLSKAAFCKIALEGVNNNLLSRFLAAKHQDQQGNCVYRRAYTFFEKLRVKEGIAKSKQRLKNEEEKGDDGFDTAPSRSRQWVLMPSAKFGSSW